METCTGALMLSATSSLRRHQQLILRVSNKVQDSELWLLAALDSEK